MAASKAPVPTITDEERRANLKKAAKMRAERAALKQDLKAGKIPITAAIDSPIADRIHVVDLIASMPGIGKAGAERIMREIRIASNRRVAGLGSHQKKLLLARLGETS